MSTSKKPPKKNAKPPKAGIRKRLSKKEIERVAVESETERSQLYSLLVGLTRNAGGTVSFPREILRRQETDILTFRLDKGTDNYVITLVPPGASAADVEGVKQVEEAPGGA